MCSIYKSKKKKNTGKEGKYVWKHISRRWFSLVRRFEDLGRGVLETFHGHQPTWTLQLQGQNTHPYCMSPAWNSIAGALPTRENSIIHINSYTIEAYPCVVAEAYSYATASQRIELMVRTIDLALRVQMMCTDEGITQAYHHHANAERPLFPPGPSGKCCSQCLHSINKNETAMGHGQLTFSRFLLIVQERRPWKDGRSYEINMSDHNLESGWNSPFGAVEAWSCGFRAWGLVWSFCFAASPIQSLVR